VIWAINVIKDIRQSVIVGKSLKNVNKEMLVKISINESVLSTKPMENVKWA